MRKENLFSSVYYKDYRIIFINKPELEVVIYTLNVAEIKQDIEFFKGKISDDRYTKMMKFRNDIDRKLLIGCEILFEYGLKQLYPHIYSPVVRKQDKAGKPFIVGEERIHFNMSHAGDYAVCAFSQNPIGVDIELIKPIDLTIAENYFCKEEYEDIMNYDLGGQIKRFYQYWVLKESFTKAVGLGLSIPLDNFSFLKRNNSGILSVKHNVNENRYVADQFSFFDDAYEIAVCIQGV